MPVYENAASYLKELYPNDKILHENLDRHIKKDK